MKKFKNLISVLLLLAIMLGCMPLSVIATETEQLLEPIVEDEFIFAPEDTKVTEVVSAREENAKHFRLPDGTFEVVSYGQAIHRKNDDGVWQDINNDLTLKTVGTKQLYTTDDSRVSFDKDANALTLSENGYSIYISLLTQQNNGNMTATTEPMTIEVDNQSVARAEYYDRLEEAVKINNRSSIIYSNVMANTDIEYIMSGNTIKENIIVKSKQSAYEYGFMLALSGLVPTLENNVISLKDEITNEEKYIIPAPYMYDANDEYSYAVEYGLVHAGGEKYLLTVTADAEWINDENRAMPVTIDPTINTAGVTADTHIAKNLPTENFGSATKMWVSGNQFSMIKPPVPKIPEAATFNHANLYTSYYSYSDNTMITVTINAYEILEAWDESTVTYNSQIEAGNTVVCSVSLLHSPEITSANPGSAVFDISGPISDYYVGDAFYGIMLQPATQLNQTATPFFAKEYGEYGAYLRVNYSHEIEGVYALKNSYQSNRWMYIEPNISAGTNLKQISSTSSPLSIDEYDASRTFKITQVGTTQRYILRVEGEGDNPDLTFQPSSTGNTLVATSCPEADSDVPPEKTFYIEWAKSGYHFRPYGSTKVIYIVTDPPSGEKLLLLNQASHGGYSNAIWTLVQYSITLYGITTGEDAYYVETFENIQNSSLNNAWHNITFKNGFVTSDECIRDLRHTNIFVSRSHGACLQEESIAPYATAIILQNQPEECVISHAYSGMPDTYRAISQENSFSNMDLAVFMGCNTGKGGEGGNNLPSMMVSKGATTAIGFSKNIGVYSANYWLEDFFDALYAGDTIDEAVSSACENNEPKIRALIEEWQLSEEDAQVFLNLMVTENDVVICGDRTLTLK